MAVKEKTIVDLFGALKLADKSQLEYESDNENKKEIENETEKKEPTNQIINRQKEVIEQNQEEDILSSIELDASSNSPANNKLIDYLKLLSSLYELTIKINESSSMAFINLARANYVNFGGISKRYSQIYWDLRDRNPKYFM